MHSASPQESCAVCGQCGMMCLRAGGGRGRAALKLADRRVAPFGALAFSYENRHGTGAARSLSVAARKLDVAEALLGDRLFPVLGKCGLRVCETLS